MAKIRYQAMIRPDVWGYIAKKKADLKLRNESDAINYCLSKLKQFEDIAEKAQQEKKTEKKNLFDNLEDKYGIDSPYTEGSS